MEWKYSGTPLAYETGCFDGKRSDEVLAVDISGEKHIARVYSGIIDGDVFVEWVDKNDFRIDKKIVKYLELEG